MKQRYIFWGAILAGLAVILGALGAHALAEKLEPVYVETFKTGVQYQMYHAFAIILVGILYRYRQSPHLKNAFIAFMLGILFFSGSLYMITIGKLVEKSFRWIGPITPIGGLGFIIGWVFVALAFYKKK